MRAQHVLHYHDGPPPPPPPALVTPLRRDISPVFFGLHRGGGVNPFLLGDWIENMNVKLQIT